MRTARVWGDDSVQRLEHLNGHRLVVASAQDVAQRWHRSCLNGLASAGGAKGGLAVVTGNRLCKYCTSQRDGMAWPWPFIHINLGRRTSTWHSCSSWS